MKLKFYLRDNPNAKSYEDIAHSQFTIVIS